MADIDTKRARGTTDRGITDVERGTSVPAKTAAAKGPPLNVAKGWNKLAANSPLQKARPRNQSKIVFGRLHMAIRELFGQGVPEAEDPMERSAGSGVRG